MSGIAISSGQGGVSEAGVVGTTLRNSLAHGNPPKDKDLLRVLKSEQDTRRFITESLQRLLD